MMMMMMIDVTSCCVVFVQSLFEKSNSSRQQYSVPQPAALKLALKPYQLASVGWMSAIERRRGHHHHRHGDTDAAESAGDWLCVHVMKCESVQSSLLFDVINSRILYEPLSPDSRLANFTVRVTGGILAGKMSSSLLHYNTVSHCVDSCDVLLRPWCWRAQFWSWSCSGSLCSWSWSHSVGLGRK